jgi:hypothetical protein
MTFITEIENSTLSSYMEAQKTLNSQGNTEQKISAGGITFPDFKLYYTAIVIKTSWYSHKNRNED